MGFEEKKNNIYHLNVIGFLNSIQSMDARLKEVGINALRNIITRVAMN